MIQQCVKGKEKLGMSNILGKQRLEQVKKNKEYIATKLELSSMKITRDRHFVHFVCLFPSFNFQKLSTINMSFSIGLVCLLCMCQESF